MILLAASTALGINADTGTITTLHLILIAILIVLVIAGILWGVRKKRARVAAEALEAERNDALLAHPQTGTAVSPAPPPADVAAKAAAPASEADARPALTPEVPAPAAAPAPAYRLIDVKGLGPKAVPLLEAQGVRDLAALAALDPARAAAVDAGMGTLSGRMARDRWIEQAKLLTAGDVAGFEATFGKV